LKNQPINLNEFFKINGRTLANANFRLKTQKNADFCFKFGELTKKAFTRLTSQNLDGNVPNLTRLDFQKTAKIRLKKLNFKVLGSTLVGLTFKRFHLAELEKNSAENASNFTRLT
jgi:hypothetical protein